MSLLRYLLLRKPVKTVMDARAYRISAKDVCAYLSLLGVMITSWHINNGAIKHSTMFCAYSSNSLLGVWWSCKEMNVIFW
jgi:hypothetical protein